MRIMSQLQREIAIATGAAGGFGEGIAQPFVAEGGEGLLPVRTWRGQA